ncbi:MAG TPA: hypothetical protein VK632_01780, partial [Verrucomicrobiae bacterium]|nr:hypothetical protein [Verrucomicrobiae bacterium]
RSFSHHQGTSAHRLSRVDCLARPHGTGGPGFQFFLAGRIQNSFAGFLHAALIDDSSLPSPETLSWIRLPELFGKLHSVCLVEWLDHRAALHLDVEYIAAVMFQETQHSPKNGCGTDSAQYN